MSKFKPPSDTASVYSDASTVSKKSLDSTNNKKESLLFSGEQIPKYNKILVCIGIIDELCTYLGVVKAEHLSTTTTQETKDIDNSAKLFLFARITQIQEALIDIQHSLGTTKRVSVKYENSRFLNGESRIKDLENEIQMMTDVDFSDLKSSMKNKPLQIIPGSSLIESRLLYARSICRRAERQMCVCAKKKFGIFPEEQCLNYLNILGDYLLALSVHILHIQNKEPLKKVLKSNKILHSNLK